MPVKPILEEKTRELLEAPWPASLTRLVGFRLSERPCLKAVRQKVIEEDTHVGLWSSFLCTHCIHSEICHTERLKCMDTAAAAAAL